MSTASHIAAGPAALVEREVKMQRMLIAYILTGSSVPASSRHISGSLESDLDQQPACAR